MATCYKCQVFNKQVSNRNCDQLSDFNPLNAQLNPICHLLALLGAHPILHVSRIRVNVGISFYVIILLLLWEWQYVMVLTYSRLRLTLNLPTTTIVAQPFLMFC
jgi:hypothetical protein